MKLRFNYHGEKKSGGFLGKKKKKLCDTRGEEQTLIMEKRGKSFASLAHPK